METREEKIDKILKRKQQINEALEMIDEKEDSFEAVDSSKEVFRTVILTTLNELRANKNVLNKEGKVSYSLKFSPSVSLGNDIFWSSSFAWPKELKGKNFIMDNFLEYLEKHPYSVLFEDLNYSLQTNTYFNIDSNVERAKMLKEVTDDEEILKLIEEVIENQRKRTLVSTEVDCEFYAIETNEFFNKIIDRLLSEVYTSGNVYNPEMNAFLDFRFEPIYVSENVEGDEYFFLSEDLYRCSEEPQYAILKDELIYLLNEHGLLLDYEINSGMTYVDIRLFSSFERVKAYSEEKSCVLAKKDHRNI